MIISRYLQKQLLSLLLTGIICLSLSLEVSAEDTCNDPSNEPPLDKEVFDYLGCSQDWLDWFRPAFNLQKAHWDEGWGWSQCDNLFREFGRMSTAAQVITYGVSDRKQEWWPQKFLYSIGENPGVSHLVATFSEDLNLHLFYRSADNDLLHATLSPYSSISNYLNNIQFAPQNITHQIGSTQLGYEPKIAGIPIIVNSPDSRIWILTAGENSPDKVLLFKQNIGNSWLVKELIDQPEFKQQFKIANPVIIQVEPGMFLVYGVNREYKLVRYLYNKTFVAAVDVPAATKYTDRLSQVMGSLSAIRMNDGSIHLFCVSIDNGHIIHFWDNGTMGAMEAEDLTLRAGGSNSVASYSILAVYSNRDNRISVYGRSSGGLLIRYHSMFMASTNPSVFTWNSLNISNNSQIEPPPSVGVPQPFPISPYFSVMRETDTHSDIFGISYNQLVHFTHRPGPGWKQTKFNTAQLGGNPIATIEPDGVQRVFTKDQSGQLFIATRASDTDSWRFINLPQHLGLLSQQFDNYKLEIGYDLTTIRSADDKRHVVGWRPNRTSLLDVYETESYAWHSSDDYWKWASGEKHGFRYEPEKSNDAYASAFCGGGTTDRVEMKCPIFEESIGPGRRGGTMLHEATHIMYGGFWGVWKHEIVNGQKMDYWIDYKLGQINHGELEGGREDHKHSMYQIQIMFWADIAEFPMWWINLGTRNECRDEANSYLGTRIINDPGWRVGEPRPLNY